MLEQIELNKVIGKEEYKEVLDKVFPQLSGLQRKAKELGIPVMIVVEGLDTSGKGTLINRIIEPLDPRGFNVYTNGTGSVEEEMHPYFWRFFSKTPERGRIAVFDCGWYERVLRQRFEKKVTKEEAGICLEQIRDFEKMMAEDGCLLIKLFTYISKKEQKKRQEELLSKESTSWMVNKRDGNRHKEYEKYLKLNEEVLKVTDSAWARWHIIEATDEAYAQAKALTVVAQELEHAIQEKQESQKRQEVQFKEKESEQFRTAILENVDLNVSLTKEEYKKKLAHLQQELPELHNRIYRSRIPVVLVFEGWDAGGKGGAIKRLTQALDPRGYAVVPSAAPNDIEKAHHYLWRYWTKMPKDGHIAIFDRSWYGRVMVERIEGFCQQAEWKRAYQEINQMERQLTDAGAVVIKFWLHIDKEEQERRFTQRQEDPEKQWKITEEDWRNRAKWEEYEAAVDEMLMKTSTPKAPWVIVEGNDKYYARIKVLETVVRALKDSIK